VEPELDRLSNILAAFNDQFGNVAWTDTDRVHQLITEEIRPRGADGAYQNALANSDKQNARIEHDKALGRVMTALLKDDTELFKAVHGQRVVPSLVDRYGVRADVRRVVENDFIPSALSWPQQLFSLPGRRVQPGRRSSLTRTPRLVDRRFYRRTLQLLGRETR